MEITISDGGIDWPAWVQAIGSVAAIFFAVLVPLYIRNLDERQRAARAVLLLRSVTTSTYSMWSSLFIILESKDFHEATSATLIERIEATKLTADQVPVELLGSDAYHLLSRCRMRMKSLELALTDLGRFMDPYARAKADEKKFAPLMGDLANEVVNLDRFRARRFARHWLVWSPADEAELESARRGHEGT